MRQGDDRDETWTLASRGCGATLNGEFWYFGFGRKVSLSSKNINYSLPQLLSSFKVSKIVGCQLARQPDMAFDLTLPACNTFLEPTPRVLLCFPLSDVKACRS